MNIAFSIGPDGIFWYLSRDLAHILEVIFPKAFKFINAMENTHWFNKCCQGKIYCNANESSGPLTCMGPFQAPARGHKFILIFVSDFYSKFAIPFLKEGPKNFISFRPHKTDLSLNAVVTFDEVN